MIWAEVPILGAILEHVISSGEDRSSHSADGLLGAASRTQPVELRLCVTGLLAAGGPGALHERRLQPRRTLAEPGGSAFAGALVISRTKASPRDQMPGRRESAHVGADLGDDDLRTERADARD